MSSGESGVALCCRAGTDVESTEATRKTQSRYDRYSAIYDRFEAGMERMMFGRLRKRLWEAEAGRDRLLEIGVGTGKNIPYYPAGARVAGIDLSPGMLRAARRRTRTGVDLVLADAQHLPFRAAAFDSAVATFVFCSVPDAVAGLREAARVLRPEGELVLLEHVRAQNPVAGKIMDLVNPAWVRLFGANINRRTVQNVQVAGLVVGDVQTFGPGILKLIPARSAPA